MREATSNDPWGPSSAVMAELADFTFHIEAYGLVMGMLWKRLNDHGKNWRHVYKVIHPTSSAVFLCLTIPVVPCFSALPYQ